MSRMSDLAIDVRDMIDDGASDAEIAAELKIPALWVAGVRGPCREHSVELHSVSSEEHSLVLETGSDARERLFTELNRNLEL